MFYVFLVVNCIWFSFVCDVCFGYWLVWVLWYLDFGWFVPYWFGVLVDLLNWCGFVCLGFLLVILILACELRRLLYFEFFTYCVLCFCLLFCVLDCLLLCFICVRFGWWCVVLFGVWLCFWFLFGLSWCIYFVACVLFFFCLFVLFGCWNRFYVLYV